jgi:hypothetical protein
MFHRTSNPYVSAAIQRGLLSQREDGPGIEGCDRDMNAIFFPSPSADRQSRVLRRPHSIGSVMAYHGRRVTTIREEHTMEEPRRTVDIVGQSLGRAPGGWLGVAPPPPSADV